MTSHEAESLFEDSDFINSVNQIINVESSLKDLSALSFKPPVIKTKSGLRLWHVQPINDIIALCTPQLKVFYNSSIS